MTNKTKDQTAALRHRMERISLIMDNSIRLPGGYRIGWDGIIGLIPGFGDIFGMAVSVYLMHGAMRAGAGRMTMLRMLANVGLEAVVGAIPLIGDLFDLTFKANARNMKLLNQQLADSENSHRLSRSRTKTWFYIAIAALLTIVGLMIWAVFSIITWIL